MSLVCQVSPGSPAVNCPARSVSGRSDQRISSELAIRIEPDVLDYTRFGPPTARDVFKEVARHICRTSKNIGHDGSSIDLTDNELVEKMTMAIFGSNMIERVGCDLDETIHLCRKAFLGEGLSPILPRSPQYRQRPEEHIRSDTNNEKKVQERREVINHAVAFMHVVEHFIQKNESFSEDLIKATHAILCSNVPIVTAEGEIIRSSHYAGRYRTRHVSAGNTNFVTPNRVSQAMARFVEELNHYLSKAESTRAIDPFYIAAHGCGGFVNIHPFLDGNGRICRLILNAILLKYAGLVVPIGGHDSERREYIKIAQRRSAEESGNGELAWFVLKKSLPISNRLRSAIVRMAGTSSLDVRF